MATQETCTALAPPREAAACGECCAAAQCDGGKAAAAEEAAELQQQQEQASKEPLSLQELVAELTQVLGDPAHFSQTRKSGTKSAALIARVRQLMARFDYKSGEWKRYAFFEPSKKYTRNLIATDHETFTLMLLCWNRGQQSPVHDHASSECWLMCVEGEVRETRYAAPEGDAAAPLKEIGTGSVHPGEVCFMNDSLGLHRIENPSADHDAVTLHLYCPPFTECNVFLQGTCKSSKACTTFFSEHGQLVSEQGATTAAAASGAPPCQNIWG